MAISPKTTPNLCKKTIENFSIDIMNQYPQLITFNQEENENQNENNRINSENIINESLLKPIYINNNNNNNDMNNRLSIVTINKIDEESLIIPTKTMNISIEPEPVNNCIIEENSKNFNYLKSSNSFCSNRKTSDYPELLFNKNSQKLNLLDTNSILNDTNQYGTKLQV